MSNGPVSNLRFETRIGAGYRNELVLSNIGNPGCQTEVESLDRNYIDCIDHAVVVPVSRRQSAGRTRPRATDNMRVRLDRADRQ
jgi:hypothetical protein